LAQQSPLAQQKPFWQWPLWQAALDVQAAPPGRVLDYATAQSFLLGIRGTIAPFAASLLMTLIEPRMVLAVAIAFMVVGLSLYYRAVRQYAPTAPVEAALEPVTPETLPAS